ALRRRRRRRLRALAPRDRAVDRSQRAGRCAARAAARAAPVTYSLAMRFVALALAFALACQQQPQPAAAASKLELVDAPPTPAGGTAATWIAGEVTRAQHDGKQLVVYVGASWCEPCQQFHAAAAAGTLDAAFPTL